MGQASARKHDVEHVRKKVGEAAAAAMADLQRDTQQLRLEHRVLATEMSTFTKQLATAQEARAVDQKRIAAIERMLLDHSERLENLGARLDDLRVRLDDVRVRALGEATLAREQARDEHQHVDALEAYLRLLAPADKLQRLDDRLRDVEFRVMPFGRRIRRFLRGDK